MDDAQAYYLYMTQTVDVILSVVGGRKGNTEALECKLEWNYL